MERKEEQKKAVSVLQGDGICISRILARESSVGQSSRVFYRSNEGVPFRWEMQPGTAKNPQQQEDVIPPICPSPLMQSLGLPLPNLDNDDHEPPSKIWRLTEMVKKRIKYDVVMRRVRGRNKEQESSRFSSICSSATSRVVDVSMADGPFCCSPWNIPAILEEGKTRIYYCRLHKNAFAVEDMSRIVSAGEQFSEVPSDAKRSTWKKAWFWIRRGGGKKEMQQAEVEGHASPRKTASSSIAPLSRGRVSKIRRNLKGISLLRSRRDLLPFARTKWRSLAS